VTATWVRHAAIVLSLNALTAERRFVPIVELGVVDNRFVRYAAIIT